MKRKKDLNHDTMPLRTVARQHLDDGPSFRLLHDHPPRSPGTLNLADLLHLLNLL